MSLFEIRENSELTTIDTVRFERGIRELHGMVVLDEIGWPDKTYQPDALWILLNLEEDQLRGLTQDYIDEQGMNGALTLAVMCEGLSRSDNWNDEYFCEVIMDVVIAND